ncbi:MAG: nitroreductase family protein [Chloroflexota bacterium]|nr:nitroreductase family protein [Chloroflexota bacterium]
MTNQIPATERAEIVLDVIRSRRAIRHFTGDAVPDELIRHVIEAGRWASSASNRRIHRFLVVRDPVRLRLARALSPGMVTLPPLLIIICTDQEKAIREGIQTSRDTTTWIDVGTSVMNMMLAAHVLGLGSCPVTSYSPAGLARALDLPETITPELALMLGYPAPTTATPRRRERLNLDDIIDWERVGGRLDADRVQDR